MSNSPTLNYLHPPITEAMIEVMVSNEIAIEDVEKIATKLPKTYSNKEPLTNFEINFENVAVNSKAIGCRIKSEDQTDIVAISQNTLTVARLAPYQGWDALHKQFVTAWKTWKKIAKTKPISRIGVRYVNRIDIPFKGEDKIDLEDYLTFCPKVPELGDFPMTEYLIQVTQPITKQWSATVTSRGLPSPLVNHVSLLLDIDVFRTENIPLNDEDLWGVIAEAHNIKNTVFQSCITEKTQELFK